MKTNYHTHTLRCKHAKGTELDYLKEALEQGLSILGFSDHAPYPDDKYSHYCMDFSELTDYIRTLDELKSEYQRQITIYKGLEIEYSPFDYAYYEKLLGHYGLDYLALGQHFYIQDNQKAVSPSSVTNTSQYIDYARSLEDGMRTGFFKFIAHPDIIFANNFSFDSNCKKACDIILSAATKYDTILEFNANGVRRGKSDFVDGHRYQYPYTPFWDMTLNSSIKVVINSDCHTPKQLWDDSMVKAHDLAREMNLNVVDEIF